MIQKSNKPLFSTPNKTQKRRYSLNKANHKDLNSLHNNNISRFSINELSTSVGHNPESKDSPILRLKLLKNNKNKKKLKESKKEPSFIIEDALKQDIRLRVAQSVQFSEWIELIQQYKTNLPQESKKANAVLREFEKLMELREGLQMRKYRLISSLL